MEETNDGNVLNGTNDYHGVSYICISKWDNTNKVIKDGRYGGGSMTLIGFLHQWITTSPITFGIVLGIILVLVYTLNWWMYRYVFDL